MLKSINTPLRALGFLLRVTVIFLFVLTAGLLAVNKYHAMNTPEALQAHYQEIYDKIGRAAGQQYPPLVFSDTPEINAYATQYSVTITKGMLDFVKNDDEIALVMGHEISHFLLKHVHQGNPEGLNESEQRIWNIQKEENADKLGAFLALQAGYDVCNGREIWTRMKSTYGDILENDTHPYSIFRYANLRLPTCGGAI